MINDQVDFGFTLNGNLFSGYIINFGVRFIVNQDRRSNATAVKLNVIQVIKDFFKTEKMQFRQSININDLQYNILGLEGVIGIKVLKLFQAGEGNDRNMAYYQADGVTVDDGESGYGFQYELGDANQGENEDIHTIIRPSLTPSVFELRNPNQDIYGKVI